MCLRACMSVCLCVCVIIVSLIISYLNQHHQIFNAFGKYLLVNTSFSELLISEEPAGQL